MALPEVHRGPDRAVTLGPGTRTRHSFSFGSHYDPDNTGFGALMAVNEHWLEPGSGYPVHPHSDVDIVTWVLAGELVHRDSTGGDRWLGEGVVQVLRSGAGVTHSEHAPADRPVHFVQMWLLGAAVSGSPTYQRRDVGAVLGRDTVVTLAAGPRGTDAQNGLALGEPGAVLRAYRLPAHSRAVLPAAHRLHLHVTSGAAVLPGTPDEPGASMRGGDTARCTAGTPLQLWAQEPTELLVWTLPT